MKEVKPDLDLLISHLEKERKALKKMIKDAAAEHDNLIVYYHSETLLDLNRRLETLYNFRDPYHNRKNELSRRIKFIKEMSFGEFSERVRGFMKDKYAERIAEMELNLQRLNNERATNYPDTKIIDYALSALLNKQYKSSN